MRLPVRMEDKDSRDAVGIDGVRLLAGQAQQDGLVGAVADARSVPASRTVRRYTRVILGNAPRSSRPAMKAAAAFIGPTVWELDGPMPILKMSKTLTDMAAPTATRE